MSRKNTWLNQTFLQSGIDNKMKKINENSIFVHSKKLVAIDLESKSNVINFHSKSELTTTASSLENKRNI